MNNSPELIERLHDYIYKNAQSELENEHIKLCTSKQKLQIKYEDYDKITRALMYYFKKEQ